MKLAICIDTEGILGPRAQSANHRGPQSFFRSQSGPVAITGREQSAEDLTQYHIKQARKFIILLLVIAQFVHYSPMIYGVTTLTSGPLVLPVIGNFSVYVRLDINVSRRSQYWDLTQTDSSSLRSHSRLCFPFRAIPSLHARVDRSGMSFGRLLAHASWHITHLTDAAPGLASNALCHPSSD